MLFWSLSLLEASLFHATLALPFFFAASVIVPTVSYTFESHNHGALTGGREGWGRLCFACLAHLQSAATHFAEVDLPFARWHFTRGIIDSLKGEWKRFKRGETEPGDIIGLRTSVSSFCLPTGLGSSLVQCQEPQQGPKRQQRKSGRPLGLYCCTRSLCIFFFFFLSHIKGQTGLGLNITLE